ncbi:response regulator [Sporomusa acidovorans]|uniref:Chemotaxis protein CheY n=1 Tax=Sporomusa acidovorans (strain ATCC 49682 / DSM 3132 / Mol) TaxID=1123286 RepID=A0ABZ3J7P8_SPOA4|nr:response regulator [Sporomusa acidovorans]OZC16634.1 chemotaxis protein CheY [Sporomusa acidovorans DSM 3132]SDE07611.1 two-component system, chemotaxis family, response regulator CheY [Sporomusa acidovorans]
MRILIAEDDLASRTFMYKFLSEYGECDLTVDGMEAIEAFMMAHSLQQPYDLICLDIMMPKVDGIKALKVIRQLEDQQNIPGDRRAKIIMTTALNDTEMVHDSFNTGCEAYAAKPIDTTKFIEVMRNLNVI